MCSLVRHAPYRATSYQAMSHAICHIMSLHAAGGQATQSNCLALLTPLMLMLMKHMRDAEFVVHPHTYYFFGELFQINAHEESACYRILSIHTFVFAENCVTSMLVRRMRDDGCPPFAYIPFPELLNSLT